MSAGALGVAATEVPSRIGARRRWRSGLQKRRGSAAKVASLRAGGCRKARIRGPEMSAGHMEMGRTQDGTQGRGGESSTPTPRSIFDIFNHQSGRTPFTALGGWVLGAFPLAVRRHVEWGGRTVGLRVAVAQWWGNTRL